MAGLLYFVPNKGRDFSREELESAGLGYAFEKAFAARECARGPDPEKRPGVILGDDRHTEAKGIGCFPEKQTWRKIPGADLWVGFATDKRPTPQQLVRETALAGQEVELGDQQRYTVPIVRGWGEETKEGESPEIVYYDRLPSRTEVDDEGDWLNAGVVPQFQELWDAAMGWLDTLNGAEIDGEIMEFDDTRMKDWALTALSTNYRVGKAEVALLGLFDQVCERAVCDVLIDMGGFSALQKKRAGAGLLTGAGSADVKSPDTAPA